MIIPRKGHGDKPVRDSVSIMPAGGRRSRPKCGQDLTFPEHPRYHVGMHARPSLPPMSLELTLALSIMAMGTLFACAKPVSTIDLSMFLQMGRWMWEHGRLLEVEPFSVSALGERFINGTWLSQCALYWAYLLGGYPALRLLLSALVLVTLAAVAWQSIPFGARLAVVGVCFAFAFLLQNLAIRPQMFSFALFAIIHLLLGRFPSRRFTPFVLFGLMAIWTNLHGAFPVVMAFPAAFGMQALLEERQGKAGTTGASPQRWLFLLAVLVAATMVNPYGPWIYSYFFENSSMPATRGLSEWLPPSPGTFLGARFFLAAIAVVALLAWKRHHLRACDVALFLAFFVLALGSQRMIAWWGLVVPPILGRGLAGEAPQVRMRPEPQQLHTGIGWVMILFWVVVWARTLPEVLDTRVGPTGDYAGLDDDTPARVATYLSSHGGGRMFHRLEWGGYLAFRLWPTSQPFIDIRVWIFSDDVWDSYVSASRGEQGWEELMARYGIGTLVLCIGIQDGLIDAARQDGDWTETYSDDQAVVLIHNE